MPISYNNGDPGLDIRTKINSLFGVESGALADPWELTFDIFQRYRTLTVDEDIELSLASAGKISQTFETLTTTGDGEHALTFPTGWIMLGDPFNSLKIQEIIFRYTGTYVIGVITTLADVPFPPELLTAVIEEATDNRLDLTFDEAVDITTAGWTVTASGGAITVSSVASGSGTTTPKLTLSRSIGSTETVTVSYDPSTGATENAADIELETVTDHAVTNNVYTISLDVPFTGGTVDTSKGTVTNPDSANLTITQNNKLIFTRTTDVDVVSTLGNFWRTVNTYGRGAYAVLQNIDSGFTNSISQFMYRVDANNDITILKPTAGSVVQLRVRSGGSTVYSLTTAISASNRFKITYNAAHEIKFWYYSGGWIQMGVTQTVNIGAAANIQVCTNSNATDAAGHAFSFDALYVTDKDYTTATP